MVATPASPNYQRLTKVAQLDYADHDESLLNDLKSQLATLKSACASFSGNTGVEGATNVAITSKVGDFESSIADLESRVGAIEAAHTQARGAMKEAKSVHGTLSPALLHTADYSAADVMFHGQPNEASLRESYLQTLAVQRNAQREAAAGAALGTMNGEVSSAAAGFSADSGSGEGDSNGGGGSSSRDAGVAGAGSRGGTQYAAGGSAGVGSAGSGAPIAGLEVLPTLAPSSSILAGVDVTTMPVGGYMTADGPAGGHIPAPVTDADDPRWKPDYNPFSTSSHSKDLAIAGGALTTGGTLAGLGRMATSATSIASSQYETVPAGGALAPSTSARLSSSNAISSVMNDLERGALTPRGTAQAGNWGNAARMANPGTPASTAARAGGFPRGMGAPGAYGSGATAGTGAGTSSTASNASTMSARARAAASIRPAGVSGTTATGAPANGAATGARGTASSAAKGSASVKAGTGSQSAAASARSASASAARAGVGARPGVMGTTAGAASGSTSIAKGSATKGASAKAASSAKASSAGTGAARSTSSNGNVSGGASSAAARGASAAAARGPIGTGAVAGAASKEEKDKAKRRALSGLKAVRVEGVEEKAPAAAGLSAGNAESLKPVAAADQDDRW